MNKIICRSFLLVFSIALGCDSPSVTPLKPKLPLHILDDLKHRTDIVLPIHTRDEKWGAIDVDGNIVVQRTYDKASWGFTSDSLGLSQHCGQQGVLLTSPHQWCYVNSNGAHLIEPQFDKIWRITNLGKSLYGLDQNPLTSEFDIKVIVGPSGAFVPDYVYDPYENWNPPEGIVPHFQFTEDLIVVSSLDEKFGYADRNGKIVIPAVYEDADPFREGFAAVMKEGKKGYINKHGMNVIDCLYEKANSFDQGIASVKMQDQWHFINKDGEIVHKWPHRYTPEAFDGLSKCYDSDTKLYGYCLPSGEWKIPPLYKSARYFSRGVAGVIPNDASQSGYINQGGNLEVAVPNAKSMGFFTNGFAWIEYKNPRQDCGYINRKGEWVWLADWVKELPEVIYNQ
ncbi:MAG: hypothetical protein COA78_23050 [Blastopirellula sp.]|nr:MAG: hypothetical protein COA78_23050 [Blastopirellula sp.]